MKFCVVAEMDLLYTCGWLF